LLASCRVCRSGGEAICCCCCCCWGSCGGSEGLQLS
jgi:hypothetical protein